MTTTVFSSSVTYYGDGVDPLFSFAADGDSLVVNAGVTVSNLGLGDIAYAFQRSDISATINGTLSSSTDTDYYRMTLAAGGTLVATLTPNASSDYDLFVYNSNGTLICSSERATGLVDTCSVRNTGTSAFTRYIRVVYWSGGTGATNGKYTLNLNW